MNRIFSGLFLSFVNFIFLFILYKILGFELTVLLGISYILTDINHIDGKLKD